MIPKRCDTPWTYYMEPFRICQDVYFVGSYTGSAHLIDTGDGLILGVGAKIFTVAGPVLLYGTLAGSIYGVIYWLVSLF